MASLSDLLKIPSKDEILDTAISLLRLVGFPATSWQSGSVPRHLLETEAGLLADAYVLIRTIAEGGHLSTAKGLWLDKIAEDFFADKRKGSVYAKGVVRLTDTAGGGPHTITAGQYWVSTADRGKRFQATTGGTLPAGGTLDITVQAESAGASYNVANSSIVEQLTPLPGVAVSNPAIGTTGTWLTAQGADIESDESLRQRMRDKWATLGSGSTEGAYRYWASTASSEVTRINVYSPNDGTVNVVVAGPSGPISASAYAAVQAALSAHQPVGVSVLPANPVTRTDAVVGTIYYTRSYDQTTVEANVRSAIEQLARDMPIGTSIYRSAIIEVAMAQAGVQNFVLSEPATDLPLGFNNIWTPGITLSSVAA